MKRRLSHRSISVLIGIGLVLVGLLVGILVMLFVVEPRPPVVMTTKQVEPVQLGRQEPTPSTSLSDSASRALVADVGTLNHLFRKVARRVTPAVVYIRVRTPSQGDVIHRFFQERDARRSVGSGVLISEEGFVVTNNHVVEDARDIQVKLADKREFSAEVVGTDPSTDLAVIKIDGENLPAAALGDSGRLKVGEWVLAVGNPFRLTSTVTAGIVSALGRQVNIIEDSFRIENFIQTDAAINPGNSGGALVNLNGELVGISTAIATDDGTNAGYGFAVPSNLVQRVVSDLISYGEVRRGFLGVEIGDVDAEAARELGLERIGGVQLGNVRSGGAADRAGLHEGDVVLSVAGQRVDAANELQSIIAQRRPGDQVAMTVWRNGERARYQVKLMGKDAPVYQRWFSDLRSRNTPQPTPEDAPSPPPSADQTNIFRLEEWGLGVQEVADTERDVFEIEGGGGAYVAYVRSGSVAAAAGLPRDVVILRAGGQKVEATEDVIEAFRQAQEPVLLRVKRRDGVTAFYEVEPPR